MKGTRLCSLLGIDYPIIQAPMAWITCPELVAAVSNAGGLGTIGPEAGAKTQDEAKNIDIVEKLLREQIRKVKTLTNRPFAVNLLIGWGKQRVHNERRIGAAIEEGISVAITSMGSPELFTQELHNVGIRVIHAVPSIKQARKAEDAGVDAVVCSGYEAGGHLGADELPIFALIPQVVDAVKIPVIAAGGIADARGFIAALALGAEGAYMGTRFMATQECAAHPNVKQAVLEATDTGTVVFGRRTGISRCLKNAYTARHMELESGGASFDELRDYERSIEATAEWRRVPVALIAGDIIEGSAACGVIAGMINEILPAGEVIRRIVDGNKSVMTRLESLI